MINEIKLLQEKAAPLSPGPEERADLRKQVIQLAEEFLDEIEESNVYNLDQTGKRLYQSPISQTETMEALLSLVKDDIDLPGINAASGRHLGYIPGGGLYTSSLGDYLAAVYNKYAGVYFAAPGAVRMENQLIAWMAELVGYETGYAGNLTSGGSIASLIGIVTARDAHKIRGNEISNAVIYASEHMHHCLLKSIHIAGMSEAQMRYVPLDDNHRMKADALEQMILEDQAKGLHPWLVIASAGTTDTGAIDPLGEIASLSEKHQLWFHVDAAYGGFFLLCQEFQPILKDLQKADSLVMDPHKGLFLPYGIGAVLIKDGKQLHQSHSHQANYMQDTFDATEEISPADLSPELSKHFRGLRMWLPLKLHGLQPFIACLEEKVLLIRYFYEQIKQFDRFEIGPYPDLTVMYFRYLPENAPANAFNEKLVRLIQEDGRVFLSSTVLDGKFVIRMAILSFRTHLREVDMTLDIIREKVQLLEKG